MQPDGLSIEILGTAGTLEYRSATLLRGLIQQAILPGERGTVSIYTDIFFAGQEREQIDVLLHASFPDGLVRKIRRPASSEELEVTFQDLLIVIEVKGKGRENVRFSRVKAEVCYDGVWKNASTQSHRQIFSVKSSLRDELKWEPWVCNLIFFPSLIEADLPASHHNYLASNSSLQNLLERLQPPGKKNAFRIRRKSMFFSCVGTREVSEREKRNRQIDDLLQVKQLAALPPSPRPLSSTQFPAPLPMPLVFPPKPPLPTRTFSVKPKISRGSFALRAALVLFLIGGLAYVLIGRRTAEANNIFSRRIFSGLPQPVLRTCAAATSGCGCRPSAQFHRGKPIFVQFIGKQMPAEESIHDPQGKVLPLSFRHSSARHTDSSCFTAKYTPGHDAAPGSYFVQATTKAADGHHAGVLSRAFRIAP